MWEVHVISIETREVIYQSTFTYPMEKNGRFQFWKNKSHRSSLSPLPSINENHQMKSVSSPLPVCLRVDNGVRCCLLNQFQCNPETDGRAPVPAPPPSQHFECEWHRRLSGATLVAPQQQPLSCFQLASRQVAPGFVVSGSPGTTFHPVRLWSGLVEFLCYSGH